MCDFRLPVRCESFFVWPPIGPWNFEPDGLRQPYMRIRFVASQIVKARVEIIVSAELQGSKPMAFFPFF